MLLFLSRQTVFDLQCLPPGEDIRTSLPVSYTVDRAMGPETDGSAIQDMQLIQRYNGHLLRNSDYV